MPSSHLSSGRYLDEGAFGSIEKASFHGSKVAVKYARPSAGKVRAPDFRSAGLHHELQTRVCAYEAGAVHDRRWLKCFGR